MAAICSFAAVAAVAQPQTFYTAFTVGGFPTSNGNAAPTDTVNGYIVWTASDIHSAPQAFVSIDLTIDGHTYAVPELGSFNLLPNWNGIGGENAGANGLHNLVDDFSISWDAESLMPLSFAYASSKRSGIWDVYTVHDPGSFQMFQIAPIPEPSSVSLLIAGLLGLGAWQVRKQVWARKRYDR